MFRLLFAKALDDLHSALVIEAGGCFYCGVGILRTVDMSYGSPWGNSLKLEFKWDWVRTVTNPDDFINTKGWEKPLQDISEVKLLY